MRRDVVRRGLGAALVVCLLLGVLVGAFVAVREWQVSRPPQRVPGEGSPLAAAPTPECTTGTATTTTPSGGGPTGTVDDVALSWADSAVAPEGLKRYQVTYDRLPAAAAGQAVVSFGDGTGVVRAALWLERDGGGETGWRITRDEVCVGS